VARLCPRRAMMPHLGVRIARASVPVATVTAVVPSVTGPGTPGDDKPVAYPATSTTSPDSIASTARPRGQEATGHAVRASIIEGRALACMITDSTVGWNIAKWVGATATTLGVSYRRTSGPCSGLGGLASGVDHGSPTAKQMANVHVSVRCDSGTA
jgi:hypothetical protein